MFFNRWSEKSLNSELWYEFVDHPPKSGSQVPWGLFNMRRYPCPFPGDLGNNVKWRENKDNISKYTPQLCKLIDAKKF